MCTALMFEVPIFGTIPLSHVFLIRLDSHPLLATPPSLAFLSAFPPFLLSLSNYLYYLIKWMEISFVTRWNSAIHVVKYATRIFSLSLSSLLPFFVSISLSPFWKCNIIILLSIFLFTLYIPSVCIIDICTFWYHSFNFRIDQYNKHIILHTWKDVRRS